MYVDFGSLANSATRNTRVMALDTCSDRVKYDTHEHLNLKPNRILKMRRCAKTDHKQPEDLDLHA